jgi:hypothetical protein
MTLKEIEDFKKAKGIVTYEDGIKEEDLDNKEFEEYKND